jgi:hypothetical protein
MWEDVEGGIQGKGYSVTAVPACSQRKLVKHLKNLMIAGLSNPVPNKNKARVLPTHHDIQYEITIIDTDLIIFRKLLLCVL